MTPKKEGLLYLVVCLFLAAWFSGGCAHYPVNPLLKEVSPDKGYRLKNVAQSERSDQLILFLTFSGGGTRAASLAYGVLEELAQTKVYLKGRERSLLDEVDAISSVSGGSFTAAYYGLFGNRIFEDFESRFLKKDIQEELLFSATDIDNIFRLLSSKFARSDLAARYYDKNLFEGRTFADMAARGGPLIVVNATDLALGTYFTFTQDTFDLLCSDLSGVPVARAVAASSAVPVILTPIVLYNYAGTCDYDTPEWTKQALEQPSISRRRYQAAFHSTSYRQVEKRPYIHLIDGGIADNLGLRGAMDRMLSQGDIWPSLQNLGWGDTRKVVFILVNAEQGPDSETDQFEKTLSSGKVMKSVTRIPIARYNFETVELLKENFMRWTEEIRSRRCQGSEKSNSPGSAEVATDPCADIQFYLIQVDFDALSDPSERAYFRNLPTSFHLSPDSVDRLRGAARHILTHSPEFQRLLGDLK